MKQQNIDFLEANMAVWTTLRDAFFVSGVTSDILANFAHIMQEEFIPKYQPDLWCGTCIADMIRDLYQRYERWKLENPSKQTRKNIKASFPKDNK